MTDRREFLRCSACGLVGLAALTVPACGGDGPTSPTNNNPPAKKDTTIVKTDTTSKPADAPKWEVSGSTIRVFLARVPELATFPSFILINEAATIVLRTADTNYTALTAICTHEGCFVSNFFDGKLICPCHGSTFSLDGAVVVGPAAAPLTRYTTSFDSATNELLITKTT
jgi:Rieske Fe-S protein